MEKSQATRLGLLAILAISLLMAGNYFMSASQGPDSLLVTFPSGTRIHVEVADTPLMLQAGLAFRDSLPPDWGMLFIYDRPEYHRLITRQYRFPVDLIWLDEARRVIFIAEKVPPCTAEQCPTYGPASEKDRYVLAIPAGFVQREHLTTGADLKFTLQL
jgi:uncharacterized membrane protein (UPF0127 family)